MQGKINENSMRKTHVTKVSVNKISRSECFHIVKPLSLQKGETLTTLGVGQGAVL